jgi:hypothetical protein
MDYPFVAEPRARAALAASRFVCYNASRRQFNKIEPR